MESLHETHYRIEAQQEIQRAQALKFIDYVAHNPRQLDYPGMHLTADGLWKVDGMCKDAIGTLTHSYQSK